MNKEQLTALSKLKAKWLYVGKPYALLGGNGCYMVEVGSPEIKVPGGTYQRCITLGIETDGHVHS